MNAVDLEYGLQYMFVEWFIWAGIIKSLFLRLLLQVCLLSSGIR